MSLSASQRLRAAVANVFELEQLESRRLLAAAGLVAAYGFEEGAGSLAGDASGLGNSGSISAGTWTSAGRFGRALSFNGASSVVSIADSASLDLTSGMTLQAWVFTTAARAGQVVMSKAASGFDYYSLRARNEDGLPHTHVYVSGNYEELASAAIPSNQWVHLAATYDGQTQRLFVNGVSVNSQFFSGTIATSAGALTIGNDMFGEAFQGTIDEVRVYNRALTQSEIQQDMNTAVAPADTLPPSVTAVSPVDGATGVTAGANVSVTFSEPMDSATITASTIFLRNSGGTLVNAALSYNTATRTATLDPLSDLASGGYTLTVMSGAAGVKDAAGNAMTADVQASFSVGATGSFNDSVVFSGLNQPTAVRFAPDGRVFVAEKSGLVKVFDNLVDTTATIFADLRTQVHNFATRGLTGLELSPNFSADPYVYVLYTFDGDIGGAAPKYGTAGATDDPGPDSGSGTTASGRLSRLRANGNVMTGSEEVLVHDWFVQYGQSVGSISFGPDGMLYASAGDGAHSTSVDFGQFGNPNNDPPNQGGAVRSQDLSSGGDPVTLDGTIIRVDPRTGLPPASMSVTSPTTDGNGVKTYQVFSQYLGGVATSVRVLTPTNPAAGVLPRVIYILPVETAGSFVYGDGLEQARLLNVHNLYNATLIAPSFNIQPWFSDSDSNPANRLESFMVKDLVRWADSLMPAANTFERTLVGFSKSAFGAMTLLLRNPTVFSAAAAWDLPYYLTSIFQEHSSWGLPEAYGSEANFDNYELQRLLQTNGQPFTGSNRIWISGDNAAFTQTMQDMHQAMLSLGIQHTWVTGATRAHRWDSGWMSGALQFLGADNNRISTSAMNGDRVAAYGLRNPGRFTFRPGTSEIWAGDIGSTWEEIDRITNPTDTVVENYGWPAYEGSGRHSGYDAANLPLIENIYTDPAAHTAPYYTYNHSSEVVSGSGEATGSGMISGIAFYSGTAYPAAYQNAMFFSDATRSRIYVMFADANGLPDVNSRAVFANAQTPVDLQTGPNGDLFYVDFVGGQVHRIAFAAATNTAPSVTINLPATSLQWKVGDVVNFSGTGSDTQDGTLAGSRFTWSLVLNRNGQTQVLQNFSGISAGSFTAPNSDYPATVELRVTVTDSGGLQGTSSIVLQPQTVNLNFASSPSGVQVGFNGVSAATPFSRTVIVNSANSISTTSPQTLGGTNYNFSAWSDGGAMTHNVVAAASPTTYTATFTAAAPAGLVAAYNFEETSGSTVTDRSGRGNTGTISGATRITSGRFGRALSFDGVNDFVSVADSTSLDLTSGMTLQAWVYPTSSSGTRNIIMKQGTGVDVYSLYSRKTSGRPESNIRVGTTERIAVSNAGISSNTWTHLAATYDGAMLRLYVNGVQRAATTATGDIVTSTGVLRLGGNSLFGEYFAGRIDEVRIYSNALTQAQIQQDMNTAIASTAQQIQTTFAISTPSPSNGRSTSSGTSLVQLVGLTT